MEPQEPTRKKNAPEEIIRYRHLEVAIWANQGKYEEPLRQISISKNYKGKGGKSCRTTNIPVNDIPSLMYLLGVIYDRVARKGPLQIVIPTPSP